MLGRRKARSSPDTIDITERVRWRALGYPAPGGRVPANIGNRFPRPQPGRTEPPEPGSGSATLLSFADTPVYRIQAAAAVKPEILHQALAVLSDRLEAQGPLAGPREVLGRRISDLLGEALEDLGLRLTLPQQSELVERLLDELIGLGPLGVLLSDDSVSDIMVHGPEAVYVERRGRVQRTDLTFRGAGHLRAILERIAAAAGCRLDEQHPVVDARLAKRTWANIVVPPVALDGPQMTIRKASRGAITMERMVKQANLSANMAVFLEVAVLCRLNIVITGAAGSGKTALLGALSDVIGPGERIVTVEDTAELRLRQAHVVPLESRPVSGPGRGEISPRQLLRSALRIRPDRVIVGELRAGEAFDLIIAMNSGREGVLSTLYGESPHDALDRLEILIAAGGPGVPVRSCRAQLAGALDLIVQVERMDDGLRRVTRITEVVGLEDDAIVTRDLFRFGHAGLDNDGRVAGHFKASDPSPYFMERVRRHGLEDKLRAALVPRA